MSKRAKPSSKPKAALPTPSGRTARTRQGKPVALASRPRQTSGEVTAEEARELYRAMHMGRILDDKAPNYLKQGLGWSYHAPCAGHDGIQVALGKSFRQNQDYLFPYYRDLTTSVAAGLSP